MTWKDIEKQLVRDLKITPKRAVAHVTNFREKYKGHKEAIKKVSASYTDEGMVKITYYINDKANHIIV